MSEYEDKTDASDEEFEARIAPFELNDPRGSWTYQTTEMRVPRDRYAQCDNTCTVDCGACKGSGPR